MIKLPGREHVAAAWLGLRHLPTVARSGLLAPLGPARAASAAGALLRWRASPATLLAVAAARWPAQTAIVDEHGSLTYAALDDRCAGIAGGLAARFGIGTGRTVAVMCRNHRGFVEATGAAARLGADVLLVNTELPAVSLGKLVERHAVDLVICDKEFADRFAATPVVTAWADSGRSGLDDLAVSPRQGGWQPVRPGRLVILTSGTTGVPKGVPRQPSGLDSAGLGVSALARLGLRTGEPMVIAPPLFHGLGAAFLLIGLLLGDTIVLRRKFTAEALLDDLDRHRAGVLVAVPAMLQRLLPHEPAAPDLRVIFSGAAPLSPALAARVAAAFGPKLYNGYGSSEVGIATIATPADLAEAPGTVGAAVEGVRVRIVDAAGRELPTGSVGRLLVGSGMTFDGYTGGGSKDVVDGLMDTGDLGHVDAAGRIFVDGRSDDMIVSGGENVFPQEVEDALGKHPDVLEAAVVGLPDEEFGRRLAAFVVPRPGAEPSDEVLIEHLRGLLPRYMVPKTYRLLPELPRNATGKVLRSQLT